MPKKNPFFDLFDCTTLVNEYELLGGETSKTFVVA